MSALTHVVLSASASTMMSAASMAKYMIAMYLTTLLEQQASQEAQATIAQTNAQNAENTISKQADAEENGAEAQLVGGTTGLAGPLASVGFGMYRGRSGSDLGALTQKSNNIEAFKTALIKGESDPISGAVKPAAQPAMTLEELKDLANTKFREITDPAEVASAKDKLSALLDLKNAKEDPDAGKLYDNVLKQLKADEKAVNEEKQSYQNKTDRIDGRINAVGQALPQAFSSISQYEAASSRRDQAQAQALQTYSQFELETTGAQLQTQKSTGDAVYQALTQEISSIGDIARANSPV